MDVVAESFFDLAEGEPSSVTLKIYKPCRNEEYNAWGCSFEINEPFNIVQTAYGESSLQALILAVKLASSELYGSELYKQRKLGAFGEFGGDLSIPAPNVFLDEAPYPF